MLAYKSEFRPSAIDVADGGILMDDKIMAENIVRSIAASFSGADSTKDWTEETI